MGLSFLSPLFLLGLAAAAIPIIIHRLSQRKAIVRKFSAVRLLLLSQQRVTRPLKLKHLLLLALRITIIASLALMLARPVLVSAGKALSSGADRALGLILDNSASMGYKAEWGERFALGKKAAKALIEVLGPNGQAVVLSTASQASEPKLTAGREALAQVEAISLSYGSSDYGQAFRQAYQALAPSPRAKEIILVTDLARGGWDKFSLAQLERFDRQVPVKVLRLGKENRDDNLAVTGLKLPELTVAGVPAVLEVTLANLSSKPYERVVAQLFLDGKKVDQKSVNLKPMDKALVNFEARLERPGWVKGEVRISEDPLPMDDKFHFALKVKEKVRALLVDGDPRTTLKAGETYFLANALNPERSAEEAVIVPKVIGPEEMAGLDLSPYRVVILANVGAIASQAATKLFQFAKAGNSLIIFVGDKVSVETYNQLFYDSDSRLLPSRLEEGVVHEGASGVRIGKVAYTHPALSLFQRDQAGGLLTAAFYRYLALENTSSALITFANGAPLLLEGKVGAGRVLLFTSSADADWNDLGLKTGYLPLMQSLVQYSAGLDSAKESDSLLVGQPKGITTWAKEAGKPAKVTNPAGSETSLLLSLNADKAGATFANNQWPGVYKVALPQSDYLYAVNVPGEESDLGKLSKEELSKKLALVPLELVEYKSEADLAALYGTRKELWPFFLLFIILLMVGETVLANRL